MWKNSTWSKNVKWVITVIVGLLFISSYGKSTSTQTPKIVTEVTENKTADIKEEATQAPKVESVSRESKMDQDVPIEYKSALAKAASYSNTMHMSKNAVYDQLISEYGEKFSPEAAKYAIDTMTADWNANALAKAKSYQDTMNMSPKAIYDQLISIHGEKFTESEANYAVEHLNK
jgi:hypothetical protein